MTRRTNGSDIIMDPKNAPFHEVPFPSSEMRTTERTDGTLIVEPVETLEDFTPNLPLVLSQQARQRADQPYLLERGDDDAWVAATYGEIFGGSSNAAAWLRAQPYDRDRPVLILSGNSILHAVIKYGAMIAHVPVCPVSVNYALMGGDYGRLRHVIDMLRPAVIFAEQTAAFNAALDTVDFGDATIVTSEPALLERSAVAIDEVLSSNNSADIDELISSVDPDAPSVYMLTSGSTNLPKAVIQTQRMITSNLAQGLQTLGRAAGWDDVMLDWLPWNHVSGAFTKMGVMISGGRLYIDGGKPMPGLFDTTIKNLKDVPVRFFTNVPAGYAMLADALDNDPQLRRAFFGKLRLALYGGAGLPQALYDRLQGFAVAETGKRVFFTTGYGATETSSGCMAIYFDTEEVGIGLPMPGLTIKLVPADDRYEIRMSGEMITPGYVGRDSADLFDEDGFLRIGDYVEFIDPDDIGRGLRFAGRLAEEFKLANGTWVAGSAIRAQLVQQLSPLVSDALICGLNEDYIGALVWLNRAAAERAFGRELPQSSTALAQDDELRRRIVEAISAYNIEHPGTSTRIRRIAFLVEPPSIDGHELSDKGTVNQSTAMRRRADDVARLYARPPDDSVIVIA